MNHDDHLDGELHDRLTAAGAAAVAPPDELTVARIERSLRDAHRAGRRPRVLAPVIAGVAASLLVVALATAGGDRRPVGTAGTGRDLGPAATTTLALPPPDGGGERDPGDREGDTTLPSAPEEGAPDRGDDGGDGGPATTIPDDVSTGTTPPRTGPTDTTAPGPAPSDTRPTDTRPTDTRATTTTTTPADEPTPKRIDARVQARGDAAVVVWSEYDGADLRWWSVVRVTEPPEGTLGPAREEVVLERGDPSVRRFVDEPPSRGRVSYTVRGHRSDGAVVARSPRVVLER